MVRRSTSLTNRVKNVVSGPQNAILRPKFAIDKFCTRPRLTPHPTADWIARQITEAFPWNEAPRYLIRDRDQVYGVAVRHRLRAMGIRDKPIAPGSPWQNGFAERLIGSIRRECADYVIALGEAHLRRILQAYARYYNDLRTHRSLDKDAPFSRPVQRSGSITSQAILGGLITTTCESEFSVHTRAATTSCSTIWDHHHHANFVRITSSLRADIIFGKDNRLIFSLIKIKESLPVRTPLIFLKMDRCMSAL